MGTLAGLRIVVTRAIHQAEELSGPLRERGAEVILLPVIAIAPPEDEQPLRRAAAHANDYDWIIFTSTNAISAFVGKLPFAAGECQARIATIGSATRRAAEKAGFRVNLTPESYVSESLAEAFGNERKSRILIPSAAVTRDVLARELRERGASVDVVEAYRNVLPEAAREGAADVFCEPYPEWVTFASPSAVVSLVTLIGIETLGHIKIASIGPITSKTIEQHGLSVAVEAAEHTAAGLVRALELALQ